SGRKPPTRCSDYAAPATYLRQRGSPLRSAVDQIPSDWVMTRDCIAQILTKLSSQPAPTARHYE
ncbi:MAG TPA: hypothetical protein VJ251_07995, partial [Stellaceae bacterium]|nr:hypothetical protein [Stellaceae bacterium]